MILVESLINKLNKSKIDFFTGVPDSVLKPFSSFIENYKHKNPDLEVYAFQAKFVKRVSLGNIKINN